MKNTLLLATALMLSTFAMAQFPGGGFGFGGQQNPAAQMEFSEKFTDINYAGDTLVYHNLDIYLPKEVKESYPVVIHIYGSAWFSNSSKGMADLGTICNALLKAGYAVVTPNHRSSGDAKYPAQINDIKAVVRFVRGEAEKYHFDTSFIGISGFSSGGHLSTLTGTSGNNPSYTVGEKVYDLEGNVGNYTSLSSKVDAVCDWSGPIDLLHMDCKGARDMKFLPEEAVMGRPFEGNADHDMALNATTYADKDDAPVIIFHGTEDNVVPSCQGEWLHEVLDKAGVYNEVNIVAGGGHGWGPMYTEENLGKMVSFLNKIRSEKSKK